VSAVPTMHPETLAPEPSAPPMAPAGSRRSAWVDSRTLDSLERAIVVVLYGWLVYRILNEVRVSHQLANPLLLLSEGLAVFFLLIRRSTEAISRSPYEWAIAMLATNAPLLVATGVRHPLVPPTAAAFVMFAGMLLQILAKLTLGRSYGCVPAHRGLKLSGPYRLVRHPMYAGYLLSHLAFLAVHPSLWNILVYGLCYGSQVTRILAEERFLSSDPEYGRYRGEVRYRLIPWLF
jgi:protein-S-isoprenylcysteine O-methyltransferase Ste14